MANTVSEGATFAELTELRPKPAHGESDIRFANATGHPLVNGGYIAATLLKAAGTISARAAPIALTAHFLQPVVTGSADLGAACLVDHPSAQLIETRLMQRGRLCAIGQLWTADAADGLASALRPMPDVPGPDALPPFERPAGSAHGFWAAFDERIIPPETGCPGSAARAMRWIRCRGLTSQSPYLCATTLLPLIDLLGIPAALRAAAPPAGAGGLLTIQLTAHFYRWPSRHGWLLGDARAERIDGTGLGARVEVWSRDEGLLGQGLVQMVSITRPPTRAQDGAPP